MNHRELSAAESGAGNWELFVAKPREYLPPSRVLYLLVQLGCLDRPEELRTRNEPLR